MAPVRRLPPDSYGAGDSPAAVAARIPAGGRSRGCAAAVAYKESLGPDQQIGSSCACSPGPTLVVMSSQPVSGVDFGGSEDGAKAAVATGPAVGTPVSQGPASRRGVRPLLPGVSAAAAVAVLATLLAGLAPVVGAPVLAIVSGIGIAAVRKPAKSFRPGLRFVSKKVLQASIVVLGSGLSLGQVLSGGAQSMPVLLSTLGAALVMTWLGGRLLGVRGDTRILIGVGTAICGASAIAAADAVIGADEADVSYAIATIFTFNVAAVLLYPSRGHALGLSQRSFGVWAGSAVNDLSSVVAAAAAYGPAAVSSGVIVKLTRTLAIIPICIGLAAWRRRQPALGTGNGPVRRLPLLRVLPVFIVVFAGAVTANTIGLIPAHWHHDLSDLSTWMITAALGAIGLSTDVRRIRRTGLRPLTLGAVLWATVGLTSLAMRGLTGGM
jgi:uncharacterized integral membrane protein (TIGR00698 family)